MGRTIVGALAAGKTDQLAIFGQPPEILEVASMSLAFEDVMTALDLSADAIFLACGQPLHASGRFYDLGELKKQHEKLPVSAALRAWIDQLLAHPDLALLQACRQDLTHRVPKMLSGVGNVTSLGRPLSEIARTFDAQGRAENLGSIGDLIPRLVGFGEMQFETLCEAILITPIPAVIGGRNHRLFARRGSAERETSR
jgi:hypothetical protein